MLFAEAFIVYAIACALVELFERLSKPRNVTGDDVERGDAPPTPHGSSWLPTIIAQLPSFLTQHSAATQLGFSRPGRPTTGLDGAGAEGYEAVPLTRRPQGGASASPADPGTSSQDSGETMFELGEEEEDNGGDDYWEEKDHSRAVRT